MQSKPPLLEPQGYAANTPILAGLQGPSVRSGLLKRIDFIEAAPVQALHSRPYSHGAYAHVVQYQRATWTACLICFPAESPERDLWQKTNLSVFGHGLQLNFLNFLCDFSTLLLTLFLAHSTYFSHVIPFSALFCVCSVAFVFSDVFFPLLSSSLSPPLPCDLLLGEVWVFGQANPGWACLVTTVLPSDKAQHCDG